MKRSNLLLIFKIIITGYTAWFLWYYIEFVQQFVERLRLHTSYNECMELDSLPSLLFMALFILSLVFQILTFFIKNQRVFKNYLTISLNVLILLSIHNLLQIIFNNKSDILLERPILLIPIIPLVFLLLIYWFTKNQNMNQSISPRLIRVFVATARTTFFVIFFMSILFVSLYHYSLIDKTFRARGQLINKYNCGEYYSPGVIPPAKLF